MAATHVKKVVQCTRPWVVHIVRPPVVHTARPKVVHMTRPSLVQYSPAGDKKGLSVVPAAPGGFCASIVRSISLLVDVPRSSSKRNLASTIPGSMRDGIFPANRLAPPGRTVPVPDSNCTVPSSLPPRRSVILPAVWKRKDSQSRRKRVMGLRSIMRSAYHGPGVLCTDGVLATYSRKGDR